MPNKPKASSNMVSRTMKKVRTRDTDEEMAVRRTLHAQGRRYRVQYRPREPDIGRCTIDIAFPGHRLAVFIDGCFWHGCPEHGQIPKAHNKWWAEKIIENQTRDKRVTEILEHGGWTVLRFWTHEEPGDMARTIMNTLNGIKANTSSGQGASNG